MGLAEAKEEVKKAADIVEVIGQYVQLKKRGQNYTGLCPFHSERTPSFTVNQSKQIYHCFGCGRGGDVFAFWMEYNNLSFLQSLKDLAERYNIPLPRDGDVPAEKRKREVRELLIQINELTADYFHDTLVKQAAGKVGRRYFSERQISQETISSFRLGYAAKKWDGLTDFFRSKRIPLERGEEAGLLVSKKDGGYYDRFRGRIMFPICDVSRYVVGFGGRVLDDSLPKYINTPETPLYHKGHCLYGLDSAFGQIRQSGLAIIVEGYMDLLALRQQGIANVVATLGTALTHDQARKLKGYAKEVVVLFDPDTAGREAALKSFPLFLGEGISATVLVLPDGEDPDTFVNRHGPDEFKKRFEGAMPIFDFYLDQALAHIENNIDGQIKVLHEVLPILMELDQGATRSLYVQRFSEKTGIAEEIVGDELKRRESKKAGGNTTARLKSRLSPSQDPRIFGSDLQFLNLLFHYPEKIEDFRDQEWGLIVSDPEISRIVKVLVERFSAGESLDKLADVLDDPAQRKMVRVVLMSQPFYTNDEVSQAVSEFTAKIASVKNSLSITKAKSEGDMETLNRLIKEDLDLPARKN